MFKYQHLNFAQAWLDLHFTELLASELSSGHSLEINEKLQKQTIVIVPVSFHLERTSHFERLFFSLTRNKWKQ